MAFLRNLLASILGFFIASGFVFLFFLIIISFTSASSEKETLIVKDNSILELDLTKPINDHGGTYNFPGMEYFNYDDHSGLYDILNAIEYAKTDDKIKGISIKNSKDLQGGIATTKAIRDALADFKSNGKFIYSYGDNYTQKEYYLSSVADSVFLNPVGNLELKGLGAEILFYKDFQDQTGIKLEVIRHGKYKSAVEPYLQNSMSDANREQMTELLNSVWTTISEDIANSRNIALENLNTITDNLAARTATLAVKNHIIDNAYYHDQYIDLLKKVTETSTDDDLEYVNIYDYADQVATKLFLNPNPGKIAIIFAQGEIMYGEGSNTIIGQDIMIKALKEAREDDDIEGVILRVNSPGGSALASDIIWREVELTENVKPVYVSMGNYAASGGYYISCSAEKIFAEPNTITGSIGVFGILPNIKELANKWGIHSEQIGTHKASNGYSLFNGLTENKRAEVKEGIETFYNNFVSKVAEGRHMTFDEVDAVARGRVWSGNDALKKGLVDEIGGLKETIEALATDKNITDYSIVTYPEYDGDINDLIRRFSNESASLSLSTEEQLKKELGTETYEILKKLNTLQQAKGIQARLPFEIEIQ
ncbi:signal peptide peptidase SppA [Neptunitalea chrysea]|uniref:Signal peptide peptidase SppA n=1 Tax=Neptunitalea chrysea TaxID=1647581 RepID=A0A9W6B2S2_9FLAO|nr:signal peptide peptidase SppA [Neptunitalea chrysea]GLB51055.1 signal peptide peptidase SppA [Neptunitalea chrysea]